MKSLACTPLLLLALTLSAWAEPITKTVPYAIGETQFEGTIVYQGYSSQNKPGVLMVPNWMGPTAQSVEKAARVAGDGYVVFMIDMYGKEVRPTNRAEAAAAAGSLRADRRLMRERVNAALEVFKEQAGDVPLDPSRIAAIGFCFGGGVVLELARGGTELPGVVSFHGNLDTPDPADAKRIKAKILVLHGANDPAVPDEQVQTFIQEMRDAGVDWQLIHYGGAVHSFTDPHADTPGRNEYHPLVAQRAFIAMEAFFREIFE
ncbi:dienelactone hydrolase family protein [Desulfonatronum sp. SC1]|uniref:dienelactone hydrolase family protein n=1 Tax=Desulfonatronum sp. SC1 TaxID=2109626 RepID=UPI000D3268F9|nr:dienelactone hydrolase family protein [Desulfonatronum sp. SC1]PTN38955.1 dienelactone hydrolase [Desulfonatronum sp. SC1]